MPTSISDMTNSTSLDGLMKDVYLPTLQNTLYNDTSLTSMIPHRTITGGGNQITHFALTQGAEGVGAFAEGGNWVSNVPVKGKQMSENVKYLNSYLSLTGPVIKAANSGAKAQVNAVAKHFETNITAFKNQFDRMIAGDASGFCAKVSSVADVASGNVTVSNSGFALAPYTASQYLRKGARFNVATTDTSGVAASGFCHSNSSSSYVFQVASVSSRDLANGTAVIAITDEDGTAYTGAGTTDIAVADYFIKEGAYNTPSSSSFAFTVCQEINGLSNLVSDGTNNSETSSNYTTFWGLDRTDYDYMMSLTKDWSDAALDEDTMLDLLMDMRYSRQARPSLMLCTPKAQKVYFLETMAPDRRFTGVTKSYDAGYAETFIQLGEWRLKQTSLASVPAGTLLLINPNDFVFAENSPFEWVLGDGGNVLVQSHTGDNKFASAVQYVELVCMDAERQAKGYSISETYSGA